MDSSCVACHNSHPDSTKNNWKEGDVRGVLEIIRPLDKDLAAAQKELRGTHALMAGAIVSLLGLSILVLVIGPPQRHLR